MKRLLIHIPDLRRGRSCLHTDTGIAAFTRCVVQRFLSTVFPVILLSLSACNYDFTASDYNSGKQGNGADDPQSTVRPTTLSANQPQLIPATPAKLNAILRAGLEQQYQDALCDMPAHAPSVGGVLQMEEALSSDAAQSAPSMTNAMVGGSGASGNFSSTNVQEKGVDEADLVKFDGRYLFIAEQSEPIYYAQPIPVDAFPVEPGVPVVLEEVMAPEEMSSSEEALIEPVVGGGTGSNAISSPLLADAGFAPYPQPEILPPTIRVMAVSSNPASASEMGRITLDENNIAIQGLYLEERSPIDSANDQQILAVVASESYFYTFYDVGIVSEVDGDDSFMMDEVMAVEPSLGMPVVGGSVGVVPENGQSVGVSEVTQTLEAVSGDATEREFLGPVEPGWYHNQNRTILSGYQVSNPAQISQAWKLELEGQYIASRMVNDTLFVVTHFYPMNEGISLMETYKQASDVPIEAILPDQVSNGANLQKLITENDCFVPETFDESAGYYNLQLVTITAVPLNNPEARVSVCMLGNSYELYASTQAMYLIEQHYPGFDIHKFALDEGLPIYHASTSMKGYLGFNNPAFRFSEQGDYLRILHSEQPNDDRRFEHRLTILKETEDDSPRFNVVATLPNANHPEAIGKPDEDVYGVRYVGDMAYVVTFQRTDPLYAINLATPENPFIAGSIEIPGFSDYLHPIASTLLLGVGREATDEGRQQGVKVSLFDVSNPANPQEVDKLVFGNQYSNSPLEYDHKALSELFHADTQTYRITMPMTITGALDADEETDKEEYHWLYDGLELLEVDVAAKTVKAAGTLISYSGDEETQRHWGHVQRGILLNDSVHFVNGNYVWSSLWNTPEASTGRQ